MSSDLNQLQQEILKAVQQLSEKATYSEFVLAKKIRDNTKISGKQKAGIGMNDLEKVISHLEESGEFYSLHMNSANDILIKKDSETKLLSADARKRRLSSEKSMQIFTNGDFAGKKAGSSNQHKKEKRSDRKRLDVRGYFDDWDE